jgi:hypothetical protein
MKKQESFRILCKGKVIYHDLSEQEMFDIMDELSNQFYETGLPNPEDLMIECISNQENELWQKDHL